MLTELTVADFTGELASDSPAPGGGSVSALSGTLSAGLIAMVCALSIGKKGFEAHEATLQKTLDQAEKSRIRLLELIDADTEAFNRVMAAFKLPRSNEGETAERSRAIQAAFCIAADVPLAVMNCCLGLMELALDIAEYSNPNCTSDLGVAVETAFAGLNGAFMNVKINLPSIRDREYVKTTGTQATEILEKAGSQKGKLDRIIHSRLK